LNGFRPDDEDDKTGRVDDMKRLVATLALSIIGLGAVAAPPAMAQQRRWVRAAESDRRAELRERIRDISDQAERSYRNGRLSRDHYNRTLAKLDRSRNELKEGDQLTRAEFDRQMRWLDEVEETLRDWRDSRADDRVNGRRVRGRYMNDNDVRNRHNKTHWMEQWRR
jgi:hypothetical protein